MAHTTPQDLQGLCRAASILRDRGKGRVVTFSPKVFIPSDQALPGLLRLLHLPPISLRSCRYAVHDDGGGVGSGSRRSTAGLRRSALHPGGAAGAALPRGPAVARREAGFRTTLEYLTHVSSLVLEGTSMLPHANPGVMSRREMAALRPVNASMGVMLEILSERLSFEGGPHHLAPSKRPRVRLKTLDLAGQLKVPFHHRHPDWHWGDPPRAHRFPSRHSAFSPSIRPRAGSHRSKLPGQGGHGHGRPPGCRG